MIISIIDVSEPSENPTKTGRTYETIDVTYRDDQGQVKSKKLVSFSHPEVYKALKVAVKGDKINIVTQKNEKTGYWDWIGVGEAAVKAAAQEAPATKGGRVTGSNYETPEERAKRQIYIVRQSSISAAVALLSVGAKTHASAEDVVSLARQFEAYVFEQEQSFTPEGIDALIAMEDDIPL